MSKTYFIYLKIWCDSVTFCQRGHFFYSPCSQLQREAVSSVEKCILNIFTKMACKTTLVKYDKYS